MKTKLITVLMGCLLVGAAEASIRRELIRCVKQMPGAPIYSLMETGSEFRGPQYTLVKRLANPDSVPVGISTSRIVRYGNTVIFTVDQGRSGYAHLYVSGKTSLLDVNLFQPGLRDMNTGGPATDYECYKVEMR